MGMDLREQLRVAPDQLRRLVSLEALPGPTTAEIEPTSGFIGQERAIEAIQFGLGIKGQGYNIYVAGPPGLGKKTIVRTYIEEAARARPVPDDLCYVFNFDQPDQPLVLSLPPGRAKVLDEGMDRLIEELTADFRKAFESEDYKSRRQAIVDQVAQEQQRTVDEANPKLAEYGVGVRITESGLMNFLVRDGEPVTEGDFEALPEKQREELKERNHQAQPIIQEIVSRLRQLDREGQRRLNELVQQVAKSTAQAPFAELRGPYQDVPAVLHYLEHCATDVTGNLDLFLPPAREHGEDDGGETSDDDPFARYRVNVLVDHEKTKGAPVVVETNPTYANLFDRLDKRSYMGALSTDFRLIKAGSLHKANSGFLLLAADDLLRQPASYEALKRALRTKEIRIEEPADLSGNVACETIRPQPAPLKVKIILIGSAHYFDLLYRHDEEFRRKFKVKAEFDVDLPRNPETTRLYAGLISRLRREESLRHFDRQAIARVLEFSSSLAEDQQKYSTRFADFVDIVREADYWAGVHGAELVTGEHVVQAIRARRRRSSITEEYVQELIHQGAILVDTEGTALGQVNGLAVLDTGDLAFGKPVRITAAVSLGREGIIDIEREAKLGGKIHSKGVLILRNYLAEVFARDFPLSLNASLCFEQNYSGIDGDSASAAEIYALLSALSGVPINQGIAVTGSVNQKGQIQAIGGANEKIEGFFDICKERKLTGAQGVIIPEANIRNLMLKEEVATAVREGGFHVWAVSNIAEGLELLTGRPAGELDEHGHYPAHTVLGRAEKRLREMAEQLVRFSKEVKGREENKGKKPAPRVNAPDAEPEPEPEPPADEEGDGVAQD